MQRHYRRRPFCTRSRCSCRSARGTRNIHRDSFVIHSQTRRWVWRLLYNSTCQSPPGQSHTLCIRDPDRCNVCSWCRDMACKCLMESGRCQRNPTRCCIYNGCQRQGSWSTVHPPDRIRSNTRHRDQSLLHCNIDTRSSRSHSNCRRRVCACYKRDHTCTSLPQRNIALDTAARRNAGPVRASAHRPTLCTAPPAMSCTSPTQALPNFSEFFSDLGGKGGERGREGGGEEEEGNWMDLCALKGLVSVF